MCRKKFVLCFLFLLSGLSFARSCGNESIEITHAGAAYGGGTVAAVVSLSNTGQFPVSGSLGWELFDGSVVYCASFSDILPSQAGEFVLNGSCFPEGLVNIKAVTSCGTSATRSYRSIYDYAGVSVVSVDGDTAVVENGGKVPVNVTVFGFSSSQGWLLACSSANVSFAAGEKKAIPTTCASSDLAYLRAVTPAANVYGVMPVASGVYSLALGEPLAFSGHQVRLAAVQSGTPAVAYFDVVSPNGTLVSKSIPVGGDDAMNGVAVHLYEAGQLVQYPLQAALAVVYLHADDEANASACGAGSGCSAWNPLPYGGWSLEKNDTSYFSAPSPSSTCFNLYYWGSVPFATNGSANLGGQHRFDLSGSRNVSVAVGAKVGSVHMFASGNIGNTVNGGLATISLQFFYSDGTVSAVIGSIPWEGVPPYHDVSYSEVSKFYQRVALRYNDPCVVPHSVFHDLGFSNPYPSKAVEHISVSDSWLGDYPYSNIFALTLVPYAEAAAVPQTICTDSDGGRNYSSSGTLKIIKGRLDGIAWDRCVKNYIPGLPAYKESVERFKDYLLEYFCSNHAEAKTACTPSGEYCGKEGGYEQEFVYCPNGCSNGACVKWQPGSCSVGWKCVPSYDEFFGYDHYKGYLSGDCHFSNITYCQNGCSGGECRGRNVPVALSLMTDKDWYYRGEPAKIIVNTSLSGVPTDVDVVGGYVTSAGGDVVELFNYNPCHGTLCPVINGSQTMFFTAFQAGVYSVNVSVRLHDQDMPAVFGTARFCVRATPHPALCDLGYGGSCGTGDVVAGVAGDTCCIDADCSSGFVCSNSTNECVRLKKRVSPETIGEVLVQLEDVRAKLDLLSGKALEISGYYRGRDPQKSAVWGRVHAIFGDARDKVDGIILDLKANRDDMQDETLDSVRQRLGVVRGSFREAVDAILGVV